MPDPVNALATYFFASSTGGSEGWTENWYVQGNDIDQCLSQAARYRAGRLKVLHQDWFLEAIRVSDLAVLGDSREIQFYPAVSKGQITAPVAEEASVCIYMRMEAGS